jgi:NAD(P)-dependent dehydrogenase (short-subunit alcohol dehydrogenase family)
VATAGDRVVVVGAGGIGSALADQAEAAGARVFRLSRPDVDAGDPARLEAALAATGGALSHLLVATGLLHREGKGPERDWRQLDPDWLVESYRVNAVIPALVVRFGLPLLARGGRPLFAVLTAKVGSIGDNRLGGWYSYRMAKAAANQLVRTAAIELKRRNPDAVALALHPGTVDTGMSQPFQRNLKAGQLVTPEAAARRLWAVIDAATPAATGQFLNWDGTALPF